MLKVCYLIGSLDACGPVNVLCNIIKNLDRNEIDPVVVTLRPDGKWSRRKELVDIGVTIDSRFESSNSLAGICFIPRRIREMILSQRIECVHSHGFRADIISAMAFAGVRKISTVHSNLKEDYSRSYGAIKGGGMLGVHLHSLRAFSSIVSVSKVVQAALAKSLARENISVVKNGVDTNVFIPVEKYKKNSLRQKYGLPEDAKLWIYAGHLSALKNPLQMMQGWLKAFSDNAGHHLLLVGNGELKEACRQRAVMHSNVSIFDARQDVCDLFQTADYALSASLTEGAPMFVLESLASGLPVALSDIPAHREILEGHDPAGILFKLASSEEIGDELVKLSNQDYDELSNNARNLAVFSYSAKQMAAQYSRLYRKSVV